MSGSNESRISRRRFVGLGGVALATACTMGASSAAHAGYRPQLSVIAPGSAAAAKQAGFHRVELGAGSFRPEVLEKTVAECKSAGIDMVSVYANATYYEADAAQKETASLTELASVVQPVGVRALVINPNPKNWEIYTPKTDAELQTQASGLNRLGEALQKRGLALHLHHHWTEVADNARELRHLLKSTDPNLVSFCIDVHWVHRGGQEPIVILEETGGRIGSLHLRNSREGVIWEDFSDGDIDYGKVARYLQRVEYAGLLTVELWYEKTTKTTRPREENLRISREYAEKTFQVKA